MCRRLSPREQKIVTHIFQKLGVRDRVQLMALHHRTPQPAGRR
jgi:hypothetical protein